MNKLIVFSIGLALGLALNLIPVIADTTDLLLAEAVERLNNKQIEIINGLNALSSKVSNLDNRITRLEQRRKKRSLESLKAE